MTGDGGRKENGMRRYILQWRGRDGRWENMTSSESPAMLEYLRAKMETPEALRIIDTGRNEG